MAPAAWYRAVDEGAELLDLGGSDAEEEEEFDADLLSQWPAVVEDDESLALQYSKEAAAWKAHGEGTPMLLFGTGFAGEQRLEDLDLSKAGVLSQLVRVFWNVDAKGSVQESRSPATRIFRVVSVRSRTHGLTSAGVTRLQGPRRSATRGGGRAGHVR